MKFVQVKLYKKNLFYKLHKIIKLSQKIHYYTNMLHDKFYSGNSTLSQAWETCYRRQKDYEMQKIVDEF